MKLFRINRYKSVHKTLSVALFFSVLLMPFAPLAPIANVVSASVGDVTYFDNPGSTLWVVPAGVTYVKVKVWGGGAAAGNGEKITNHNRAGLGGGAGGYTDMSFAVTPGQTYLIDVGAGGQGIRSYAEGRLGNSGGESKFEGNGIMLRATGGTGGTTSAGMGNPTGPIGLGGIGDGGPNANNQGGQDGGPYTFDGDNPDSSSGGSAYDGGNGGSRGRLGRDGLGHCNGYTEAYTGGPLNIPCSSTDAWAKDGGFPGGGGGGSDTGVGGFGGNGRVTIEEVAAPDAVPQGFLDEASCTLIGGWAYDPDDASAPVGIHFYANGPAGSGTFIGNVTAGDARPDVNNQGIPGNHGYNFLTPDSLKDGQSHDIYAYAINTNPNGVNTALTNSADNITDHKTLSGCTITPPQDLAPTAPAISGPTSGTAGISYSFSFTSTDPENSTLRYGIDWDNNGSMDEFSPFVASGVSFNTNHTWPAAGSYTFKAYALDSTNANQSPASSQTVVISPVAPVGNISSVSVSVSPNPAVIPVNSSLQLVVDSTAAVSGNVVLTNHGIEKRVNGGAWQNAGAWSSPAANTNRTSDNSFTNLNVSSAGTYEFRTYASIDNGTTYTYSNITTVPVTVASNPSSISSVSISVAPNPVVVTAGGSVQIVVTSTANVTGPASLTQHGIEKSTDGGATWQNAGAWSSPAANTNRASDNSFTALSVSAAGTIMLRTYASIDNGTTYTYSNAVTVPISVVATPTLSAVSISATPNPVVIPFGGGNVSVTITSTATASGASLTHHGVEKRINGGAWQNAGAWPSPAANVSRTSNASFSGLVISSPADYDFRVYASIDNGATYVYSNIVNVPATVAPGPVTTLNSVSVSVSPNLIVIPIGGSTQVTVGSTASVTGPSALTNHGIEMRLNGGAWQSAGVWASPVANTARTTDNSFTTLALTAAGTYEFRTYGSIDSDLTRVYSSITSVSATMSSSNHTPVITGVTGPTTGTVNNSYVFIATATDQDGDTVEYGFDWNNNGIIDGTESWTPAVASGTPTGRSNIWTINGTQSFQVLARDSNGATVSFPVSIVISGGASNIGFTVTPSSSGFSTSEQGGTTVFTVVLDSAPLANVTFPVLSSDFTEGTTSVTSLVFTPSNWNVMQTVTLTGVNDNLLDGDISYIVTIGPSTSSDVNYNNLPAKTVSLVNTDDEINSSVGVTIGSFSVGPTSIVSGNAATISWSATNATLCVASGGWSGNKSPTGGSQQVGPYIADTVAATNVYVLNCGNSTGTTTATTTLTVNPSGFGGGSSSGGGGSSSGTGSGPCVGFNCLNTTTAAATTNNDITIYTGGSTGGDYPPTTPNPAKACNYADFVTTYLKRDIENNPNEVKKLQYFLNTYDGATLPVNGTFDVATEDAVKAFQSRHSEEVLSPWGTNAPTGIVYITTKAAINRIFCGANPTYKGDDDIKDIINPVLYTPVDNSGQFQNVVGSAATTSTSTNIAGVFGAISGDILGLLKGVPWYELILLLILLLGTGLITQGIFKKDIQSRDSAASFVQGITLLAVGSVLNVLNTLSFMIRPDWFSGKAGMTVSWILGLDVVNLMAVVVICLGLLVVIHRKLLASETK